MPSTIDNVNVNNVAGAAGRCLLMPLNPIQFNEVYLGTYLVPQFKIITRASTWPDIYDQSNCSLEKRELLHRIVGRHHASH